jgi:hypothetical protein
VGQDFGHVDIVALHITVPRINVRKKPLRKRYDNTTNPPPHAAPILPLIIFIFIF